MFGESFFTNTTIRSDCVVASGCLNITNVEGALIYVCKKKVIFNLKILIIVVSNVEELQPQPLHSS